MAGSLFDDAAQRYSEEIEQLVLDLKRQRDAWQATALLYKQAFETQTAQFREILQICVATQADLTNERNINRRLRSKSRLTHNDTVWPAKDAEDRQPELNGGLPVNLEPAQIDVDGPTIPLTCANFQRVEQFAGQRDFTTALNELERLLRGPLSCDARIEGLLLKSTILRAADPDLVYDALAACSEALQLCETQSNVQPFISKVQYHRGICYFRAKMLSHAQNAFAAVSHSDCFYDSAMEFRKSIEEEIDVTDSNARYGFEEDRSDLQPAIERESERIRLRQRLSSTHASLFSASQTSKRLSLPSCWKTTEE